MLDYIQQLTKLSDDKLESALIQLQTDSRFERFRKLASIKYNETIEAWILSAELNQRMTDMFRELFVNTSANNILLYEYKSNLVNAMTFPLATDGTNVIEEWKKELNKSRRRRKGIGQDVLYSNANLKMEQMNSFLNIKKTNDSEFDIKDNGLVELLFDYPLPIMYSISLPTILTDKECIAVFLHEIGHHIIQPKMDKSLMVMFVGIFNIINIFTRIFIFIPPVLLVYLCLSFLLLIPNNLIDRKLEYESDSFAAMVGYGDEIISSLKKIDIEYDKYVKSLNMFHKMINSIADFFNRYLKIGVHPTFEDREQNVKNTMNESIMLSESILNNIYDDIINNITKILEYALS